MIITKTLLLCIFTIFIGCTYVGANENNAIINDLLEERRAYKAAHQSITEWRNKVSRSRKKRADKIACYGDLGCFEDSGPYAYLEMLPSPPDEINTKFYVYSAKNRSEKPILEFYYDEIATWINANSSSTNASEAARSRYAPEKIYEKFGNMKNVSSRVIVHGFGSSCTHVWIYEMRTALMAVEDCMVLCMDWENGASLPNYVRAAANTRLVGKQLSILLKGLEKHNSLDMSRVHLIGFSLGAHAAGFAGAEIDGLHRITGLDPAGPLFESQHPKARLDDTDAGFVDVVHSNGENLILGGLGSWQPMGSVDFYPNGGRVQHGCSNLFVGAVTDIIWAPTASVEGRSLCNHRRAYKFFIDSVAPKCLFPAFPCDSYENFLKGQCFSCERDASSPEKSVCGNMGYYANKSTGRGQLYLKTREEEPFCAHQYKLQIQSSPNELPLRTLGRLEVELESDGGLTEVFTITDKDDSEIFAGDMISQILVPHPALGFPKNLTITYIVYKGWLTRGLSTWNINKIILSDGFGKSFSICKNLHLKSNNAVHITLSPGECDIDEDFIQDPFEIVENNKNEQSTESSDESDESGDSDESPTPTKTSHEKNDIGIHYSVKTKDGINERTESKNLPWQPIIIELPRNYRNADSNHTYPDYATTEHLIVEPLLKRSHHEARKLENKTNDRASDKRSIEDSSHLESESSENKLITVQLFPYRFANVFEKAERYARLTILPLLSEQFPSFFKAQMDSNSDADLELEFNSTEPLQTVFKTNRSDKVATRRSEDIGSNERRNFKGTDTFSFLDKPGFINEDTLFNIDRIDNDTHANETRSNHVENISVTTEKEDPIRIELPTFKPPSMKERSPIVQQQSQTQQQKFIPLNYVDDKNDNKPNDNKN